FPGIEPHPRKPFTIDIGDKFALAQIADHLLAQFPGNAEGQSDTGAALVEPEHEARTLRRASMDKRSDTQRPAETMEMRTVCRRVGKSGPPHQGPVAKDPKIDHIAYPDREHPANRNRTAWRQGTVRIAAE